MLAITAKPNEQEHAAIFAYAKVYESHSSRIGNVGTRYSGQMSNSSAREIVTGLQRIIDIETGATLNALVQLFNGQYGHDYRVGNRA